MTASEWNLDWFWIALGVMLGVIGLLGMVYYLGPKLARRMHFEDRGDWDRPLAKRFPPDQPIVTYKRRRRYHQHDRFHYRRVAHLSRTHKSSG